MVALFRLTGIPPMRFIKRLFQGLLALIVLALAGAFIAQPTLTTRLVGLAFGGDQGPRQTVAGGTVPALVVADGEPAHHSG